MSLLVLGVPLQGFSSSILPVEYPLSPFGPLLLIHHPVCHGDGLDAVVVDHVPVPVELGVGLVGALRALVFLRKKCWVLILFTLFSWD